MLKTYQYFFVALFLGSMLFTVFQYIPILEEEIHASKTMSKKAADPSAENDGADDAGDDEGDEDDNVEFFDHSHNHNFLLLSSNSKFNAFHENYFNLVFNISTPPPKLV